MQIVKKDTGYITEDNQVFTTLGAARGHAHRLAIAHYLMVLRHQLHEETGVIHRKLKESLLDLGDAIGDIFQESANLRFDNGQAYVQAPVFTSRLEREKRDGRVYDHAVYKKLPLPDHRNNIAA